jgi:UDP-N-acetylmuramoyl-tripeptide--D-alanyl-D-alanine ligase
MENFFVKDLLQNVNGKLIKGNMDLCAFGVSIDTRTIKKGEAYFALQGKHYDGHNFIKEAVSKGAAAIIYSDEKYDSSNFKNSAAAIKVKDTLTALGNFAKAYKAKFKDIKIVGITGSNGKTTAKEILVSILSLKGKTLSNKGNFNNRIGLPISLFNLTSDAKYAVFEMGTSLFGEIKILADILRPNIGAITNIGYSHLETFLSPSGVFEEKKVLFDFIENSGFAVVNNDDTLLKTISFDSNFKVKTFALNAKADVFAKNIMLFNDRVEFKLFHKNDFIQISMRSKGVFNVSNALCASASALSFGFSLAEIKSGIENFIPPKMRMETVTTKTGAILINDAYNANPSSMKESILAVKQIYPDKNICLVLGDMLELGEKSDSYHRGLGKFIASQNINSVYLLGEITSHTKAALANRNVFHSLNSDDILNKLNENRADKNTVFLFKASRGMKLEIIFQKFYDRLERF